MANLDPRAIKDQWESAVPQECQDFQAQRDTGDCLELTVPRDLKGNKVSPETWESPVQSVLPVQWVPVAQVESVVALDPQAPRIYRTPGTPRNPRQARTQGRSRTART